MFSVNNTKIISLKASFQFISKQIEIIRRVHNIFFLSIESPRSFSFKAVQIFCEIAILLFVFDYGIESTLMLGPHLPKWQCLL